MKNTIFWFSSSSSQHLSMPTMCVGYLMGDFKGNMSKRELVLPLPLKVPSFPVFSITINGIAVHSVILDPKLWSHLWFLSSSPMPLLFHQQVLFISDLFGLASPPSPLSHSLCHGLALWRIVPGFCRPPASTLTPQHGTKCDILVKG